MSSQTVQQFFADYFIASLLKGSQVNSSNSFCLNTVGLPSGIMNSTSKIVDSSAWQYQQFLNKLKRSNVPEFDVASVNGIIVQNNYLKYCQQRAQTMKLCDILDIHTDSTESQTVAKLSLVDNATSIEEDGEINFREDDLSKDFLNDFLYLMEATKRLPIKTQNIIILHFASEYRELMKQQSTRK